MERMINPALLSPTEFAVNNEILEDTTNKPTIEQMRVNTTELQATTTNNNASEFTPYVATNTTTTSNEIAPGEMSYNDFPIITTQQTFFEKYKMPIIAVGVLALIMILKKK